MSKSVDFLCEVIRKLRDSKTGCPWDIKQDFQSITDCLLEEAYEVIETIENNDMDHLCEELGDLLLQIVFYSQMASEKDLFTFDDVAQRNADKMIERHPHVFGDLSGVNTAEDVLKNWEADKAKKREEKAENKPSEPISALDGIPTTLPALTRSLKLQKRAARVGFDWDDPIQVFDKIREEIDELEAEFKENPDKTAQRHEIGDLFFAITNLARHLKIDPETSIRYVNRRFEKRFRYVEKSFFKENRDISDASLDEMEEKWNEAKKLEKEA